MFLQRPQTILHQTWEAHTELKMFAFHYFDRQRIATADLKASSHLGKSQPSASSFGVWALSFWLWSSSGWVIPLAVKDESRTYGLVAFLSYWWNVIWQKVRVSGFCWKSKKYVFDIKGRCGKSRTATNYRLTTFQKNCWLTLSGTAGSKDGGPASWRTSRGAQFLQMCDF